MRMNFSQNLTVATAESCHTEGFYSMRKVSTLKRYRTSRIDFNIRLVVADMKKD